MTTIGQHTTVRACDPGPAGTAGTRSRNHALDIVDERNNAIATTYDYASVSPDVAQCVGDVSLGDTALAKANAAAASEVGPPTAVIQRTIDRQMLALIASCRSGASSVPALTEGVRV